MKTKHPITLSIDSIFIFPLNLLNTYVDAIALTDFNGNSAVEYKGYDDHPACHLDTIFFTSSSPFLFIPDTPRDWEPCAGNSGIVWNKKGGAPWGDAVESTKSGSQYVLELTVKNQPSDSQINIIFYRLLDLQARSMASRAGFWLTATKLAALLKQIKKGGAVPANAAIPTIHVTGNSLQHGRAGG